MAVRNVISTLTQDGTEVMGPGVLRYHYPGNDIMNGSLLTVESNHFCVLKSRGAILNVYYGITGCAAMPGLDSRGNGHAAPVQQAPARG